MKKSFPPLVQPDPGFEKSERTRLPYHPENLTPGTHARTHGRMHTHTHQCTCVHTHLFIFSYTCLHSCLHPCLYTYLHSYLHPCLYTRLYTYTHVYVHVDNMSKYMSMCRQIWEAVAVPCEGNMARQHGQCRACVYTCVWPWHSRVCIYLQLGGAAV